MKYGDGQGGAKWKLVMHNRLTRVQVGLRRLVKQLAGLRYGTRRGDDRIGWAWWTGVGVAAVRYGVGVSKQKRWIQLRLEKAVVRDERLEEVRKPKPGDGDGDGDGDDDGSSVVGRTVWGRVVTKAVGVSVGDGV